MGIRNTAGWAGSWGEGDRPATGMGGALRGCLAGVPAVGHAPVLRDAQASGSASSPGPPNLTPEGIDLPRQQPRQPRQENQTQASP